MFFFFFFFKAEDGIRDKLVTGVQTCALPISFRAADPPRHKKAPVNSIPLPFRWMASRLSAGAALDFKSGAQGEYNREIQGGKSGPCIPGRPSIPRAKNKTLLRSSPSPVGRTRNPALAGAHRRGGRAPAGSSR